ncbi:MAG: potassium transporter TrkG, partial [Eubacteriales bacterium]|nr:potassium transporter TrkG [Eubacteriales bacterium]
INFNIYYYLAIKRFNDLKVNEEWKVFLAIVGLSVLIIALNLLPSGKSIEWSFRAALFQVASIISTSGFSSTNFDLWPQLSKTILIILMVVGACAGSTGGGIKVSRLIIMYQSICKELKRIAHPHSVSRIKMNGKAVEDGVVSGITIYLAMYVFIFGVSILIVSLDNFDFETTFTAVLTCFNNVGPGFGEVGPAGNFHALSNLSKIVLSIDMLLGRLELLPILLLATPSFWKK